MTTPRASSLRADGWITVAPPASALFCGLPAAWLLAAQGRREAPSPASGPMNSSHDEFWAADRSHRRFATLDDLKDPKPSRRVRVDSQNRQEWHARSTRCSVDAPARRPVTPGGRVGIQNSKLRTQNFAMKVGGRAAFKIEISELRIQPVALLLTPLPLTSSPDPKRS